MPALDITDEAIAALTPDEREALIERLERPVSAIMAPATARRVRRRRLVLIIGSVLVLIPWTIYLGFTLPQRYVSRHWTVTWVGFDVLLIVMFALTAYLALRRRQLLVLASFVTGVLLVCDAWFDVTTASGHDLWLSAADAALVELPIALILMASSLKLLSIVLSRLYLLEHGRRLWNVPLGLVGRGQDLDARTTE